MNYENLNKIELGLPMNIELTFAEMKYIDFVDLIIKIPDFDPEAEVETTRFFSILNSVRKTTQ